MAETKKSRKHGRYKNVCAAYRISQRAEFNKARRLIKYLRKFPDDRGGAREALVRLASTVLYSEQRKRLGITVEGKPV